MKKVLFPPHSANSLRAKDVSSPRTGAPQRRKLGFPIRLGGAFLKQIRC